MSQPAVSKHLKVLEETGLIIQGRHARQRPRKAQFKTLAEIGHWLESYRSYITQELSLNPRVK